MTTRRAVSARPTRAHEVLTRPIPVYFAYITAWAEPDGRIMFRPDIYNRDGVRDLVASNERDPEEGPAPRWSLAP